MRQWLSDNEYRACWNGLAASAKVLTATGYLVRAAGLTRKEEHERRALVAWSLMGEAGLRVAETVKLLWGDLHSSWKGDKEFTLPPAAAKGYKMRVCQMTVGLAVALKGWRDVIDGKAECEDRWAVMGNYGLGSTMSIRGVQRVIERVAVAYLGRRISPHDLRRTFGDRCRRYADVRTAQLMLGHDRLESTERYLGDCREERARALGQFNRLLFGSDVVGRRVGVDLNAGAVGCKTDGGGPGAGGRPDRHEHGEGQAGDDLGGTSHGETSITGGGGAAAGAGGDDNAAAIAELQSGQRQT